MPYTGLATDSTRRRRTDIWSDEISWSAPPSRGRSEAHAEDAAFDRHASTAAASPRGYELWREEWTSAIPEEWRLNDAELLPSATSEAAYASRAAGVVVLQRPASVVGPAPRRTVKISGRGAERATARPGTARSRQAPRAHQRAGFQPDRMAMWAVLLGLLLILVAAII